ncbi:hypothetical protein BpHYR1_032089 [Brachionus plicatilis]|uniref:Uncharacterized protein n=1 Tax=Brachionus plicatilis TaxID=10195 RepID=A0A3M7T125_BRAPC|nr:hypothetical protein BpHYR1_032089 [Brachionus plicatilis]
MCIADNFLINLSKSVRTLFLYSSSKNGEKSDSLCDVVTSVTFWIGNLEEIIFFLLQYCYKKTVFTNFFADISNNFLGLRYRRTYLVFKVSKF